MHSVSYNLRAQALKQKNWGVLSAVFDFIILFKQYLVSTVILLIIIKLFQKKEYQCLREGKSFS